MPVGTIAHHLVVPLVILLSLNVAILSFWQQRKRKAGIDRPTASKPLIFSLFFLFAAMCIAAMLAR